MIIWFEMNLPHIQGAEHLGPSATAPLLSLVEQRAKVTSFRELETPVPAEKRPIQKVDFKRYLAARLTQARYCSIYRIQCCTSLSLKIIVLVDAIYGVLYHTVQHTSNLDPSLFNR